MASAAGADLPGLYHEADWGELSEESDREEDPVLEPELPSGTGKKRSESLEEQRELRPERGLLPEKGLLPERGQLPVHRGGHDPEGWQLPVSVHRRVQDPESLLLQRPEEPLPELPEEIPELDLQLEEYLPEVPLPPYLLPGEEGSGELPQPRDRDLPALQDGKEDEESGREERERERERGRKRQRSKERRKRDKEERRRRKEKKGERRGKRGPRKLLTRSGSDRQEGRQGPRSRSSPGSDQGKGARNQNPSQGQSTKAKASPEPKPKPRVELDLRIPIIPPVVRPGKSLEQSRRNFEMYQQAETNRLRRLSMYVAAVAKTAAELPLPQPEDVKKDTKEPKKVLEERHKTKLEERMEREALETCECIGDAGKASMPKRVKKRRSKSLQGELSREHTGVYKKESQKSLEREKKEKERRRRKESRDKQK